jgi:hypothetical protein
MSAMNCPANLAFRVPREITAQFSGIVRLREPQLRYRIRDAGSTDVRRLLRPDADVE